MIMMRLLSFIFLFVFFTAQPASAEDQRDRILLLDLKATLIEEEVVGIITNMVSAELSNYEDHFEIITNADMRQMVALEAESRAWAALTTVLVWRNLPVPWGRGL